MHKTGHLEHATGLESIGPSQHLGSIRRLFGAHLLNATFSGLGENMGCCCETERHYIVTATCNLGLPLRIVVRVIHGLSVKVCSKSREND